MPAAARLLFDREDAAVATLVRADVAAVVRSVNTNQPMAATRELIALAPEIVERWASPQATIAADFYDELRDYYGAAGGFSPSTDVDIQADAIQRNVRWAVEPIFSPHPDVQDLMSRLSGALERHVRNAGRDVIESNAIRDRATVGWRRVARPGACAWCVMLATRWGDYTSKAAAERVGGSSSRRAHGTRSAGSAFHDHCRCRAEPVYPGWQPSQQEAAWDRAYQAAVVSGDVTATLANLRRLLGAH